MIELYSTKKDGYKDALIRLLSERVNGDVCIKTTANGKPYIEGNAVYFNVTHSGSLAIIAICDKPVGVDFEAFRTTPTAVFNRLTDREKLEVKDSKSFLKNWTAKEAFVKFYGESVLKFAKRMQFFGNAIYLDGERQSEKIIQIEHDLGIISVCVECDTATPTELEIIEI